MHSTCLAIFLTQILILWLRFGRRAPQAGFIERCAIAGIWFVKPIFGYFCFPLLINLIRLMKTSCGCQNVFTELGLLLLCLWIRFLLFFLASFVSGQQIVFVYFIYSLKRPSEGKQFQRQELERLFFFFFWNSINWITKYTGISLIPPWSNILLISCQRILFTCLCSPCHYINQAEFNFIYSFEMCSCISRWKPEWCFWCIRSHMDVHVDESTPYILKNTSSSVCMQQ